MKEKFNEYLFWALAGSWACFAGWIVIATR